MDDTLPSTSFINDPDFSLQVNKIIIFLFVSKMFICYYNRQK